MSATDRCVPVVFDVETVGGPGRVHLTAPARARGSVIVGHGAGGGLGAVDIQAAAAALTREGWAVALVEQPWRVAGRRLAGPPGTLDAAWVPIVQALRARGGALGRVGGPLVLAGRSAGARVACRTAAELGADAVLCLSFPLHPPGRPDHSRHPELALVTGSSRRVAAVQGEKDPFGTPGELTAYLDEVFPVPGTHTIPRGSAQAVGRAAREFVASLGAGTAGRE